MRYLGVDFGEKNVGLASSDQELKLAFPLVVLKNDDKLLSQIEKICQEKEVGLIVVGESKNYSGQDNKIMKDIKIFVENLKGVIQLPIEMHPEFLTSVEAERVQGKNEMHDASSAALILKSFIETKNGR